MDNSEDQVELTNVENPLLKEEFKESCVEADHESESPQHRRLLLYVAKILGIATLILYLIGVFGINIWVNLPNRRVIELFGDSLTQRPCKNYNLQFDLNNDLYNHRNQYYPEVVCSGYGGATISMLRDMMHAEVLHRFDYSTPFTWQRSGPPEAVILYWDSDVNSNNAPADPSSNVSVAAYLDNLYAVIERLQRRGVVVILAGPTLSGELPDGMNALDAELNYYVQLNNETAIKYNISYLNTRAMYYAALPAGWNHECCYLTSDGEHPNSRGTDLLRDAFKDALLAADIF